MARNIFKGLGIALITPFTPEGEVDYKSLKRLVEHQLNHGADFFCILATTAEAPCLTQEEKDKITQLVKDVVNGRVPILKYCGGNNTAAVIEEMQSTDWSGIDGILSICPYYNKPSQEGLYQHFKAISKASPLPLVLYNVPGRTGVNMKASTTLRLAHECENIVGIKEAAGSLEQVDEIIYNKPDRFDVISGDDALTFSMVASGAAKAISEIGGAKKVYACATHGVLSGPAIERIENSCIEELLLLDTIPYPSDKPACSKIKYISTAPVFAEAIRRIYEEVSISNLFD